VIIVVAAATPAARAGTETARGESTLSGAYAGNGSPAKAAAFGRWRHRRVRIVVDYLDRTSWSDVSRPTWLLNHWENFALHGGKLVLSVPLLISEGDTLAQGAGGRFDGRFRALARQLVAHHEAAAIIRPGWEFNATDFLWSLSKAGPGASKQFVGYWRRVVSAMRSVRGSHFRFDWTVNLGSSPTPAETAWPGRKWVNYIGLDAYDFGWAADGGPITDAAARWAQIDREDHGLEWWHRFARRHHRPIAVPEWGLSSRPDGHGGGDDPLYIRRMHSWFSRVKPAYECYFNAATSVINGGRYPRASREYVRLWRSRLR
jgi:hypothetical protein